MNIGQKFACKVSLAWERVLIPADAFATHKMECRLHNGPADRPERCNCAGTHKWRIWLRNNFDYLTGIM